MIRKTRATTAHAVLPYADVLAHGSCSLWFQNLLETITAVVLAVLTPGVGFAGGRLADDSNEAPANEPHPQRVGSWPSSASFLRY
jgi:hypothetical protein